MSTQPQPAVPLDLDAPESHAIVRAALEAFMKDFDYDTHKAIACGEEDGVNRYDETTSELIAQLRKHLADKATRTPTASPLDLDAIQARCDAATEGDWWVEEDDRVWTLHGVHARILSSDPEIGYQILNRQILKAPKTGTPYAEYWPNRADAEFIVAARQDVPALLARVRELKAELAGMTNLRDRALARQDELRAEVERLAKDRDFWLDVTRDARNLIATAETPEQALDEVRELLNP